MFKKSLAALAVLGAAAGYASAADVTLFGVVDTGLIYTHQTFADDSKADVNKFSMDSGVSSASRFGLKGTEELGNGLKVGFKLENGFQSDSGALKSEKRIFDREASVSVYSDFGTLKTRKTSLGRSSKARNFEKPLETGAFRLHQVSVYCIICTLTLEQNSWQPPRNTLSKSARFPSSIKRRE